MRFFKIKNKIKKSPSLNFFCFIFYNNLKPFDALSFLTPHVSADLTTVKSTEPAPPQGGSYSLNLFRVYRNFRGISP